MEAVYARVGGGTAVAAASLERLRPRPAFDQGSASAYRPSTSVGFAGLPDFQRKPVAAATAGGRESERSKIMRDVAVAPSDLQRDTFLYLVFSVVYPEDVGVLVDVRDIRSAVDFRKQELYDAVPRLASDPGVRQSLLRCFGAANNADDWLSVEAASFVSEYVREVSDGRIRIETTAASAAGCDDAVVVRVVLSPSTQCDGRRRYNMRILENQKNQDSSSTR